MKNADSPSITAHPGKPNTAKPKDGHLLRWLAALSLLAGLQSATQYFAYVFQYQAILGANILHIYPPWAFLSWFFKWFSAYKDPFQTSGYVGVMVSGLGLFISALSSSLLSNRSYGDKHLHGSARWADREDIKEAGLMDNHEGVYVGGWEDENGVLHYLRHNGPEHVLTYAPTRSGKGVSLVLPTLLSWPHSLFCNDLKGELFALTSGWRQKYAKNKIIKFEPASMTNDARWNPLDEIRLDSQQEVGDVQNLTTLLVDPDGKGLEDHWQKTAQALLVGVILHVLYKSRLEGTPATLPYVDRLLSPMDATVNSLWLAMTQYPHVDGKTHPAVASAARDMLDRPEEEAGSVLSTAKSYLSLYRDPVVANAVSASDFCVQDLVNHDFPVSLYIVTSPSDKSRLRPLTRILIDMVVRVLTGRLEYEMVQEKERLLPSLLGKSKRYTVKQKPGYQHRLLGMLDEFPSLGRLGIMEDALAYVAGYGIKFYLICQDIKQLKNSQYGYGADETISSNCHIQNAFPPNNVETAEYLSKLTGETTVIKEEITTSGTRQSFMLGQVSKRIHEVHRALLTIDECLRLPGAKKDASGQITQAGAMVIYVAGFPAIYGKQPLYFKDPVFLARSAIPFPDASDKIRIPVFQTHHEVITLRGDQRHGT